MQGIETLPIFKFQSFLIKSLYNYIAGNRRVLRQALEFYKPRTFEKLCPLSSGLTLKVSRLAMFKALVYPLSVRQEHAHVSRVTH